MERPIGLGVAQKNLLLDSDSAKHNTSAYRTRDSHMAIFHSFRFSANI